MGSIPPELSLEIRPTYVPKSISCFLGELKTIGRDSERLLRVDDFVERLEEEIRKIDAFKRELPLCMRLLNDAIGILKEELMQCRRREVEPILEEFIPLKKNHDEDEKSEDNKEKENKDKMNWMSSVQLWNADDCENINSNCNRKRKLFPNFTREDEEEHRESGKNRKGRRVFLPFQPMKELPVAGLSLVTPGIMNPWEQFVPTKTRGSRAVSSSTPSSQSNLPAATQQQTARKQRRCWSPELHRRFVSSLEQLGGPQVATPKQIREVMQVDGLTNDEVKSHLQKYRLHSRKPAKQSMGNLGDLWMSEDQSPKQSNSQSGSPQGPLQLAGTGGGTSATGGDSMEEEEEEEENEKSEGYGLKSHIIPISQEV